MNIHGAEILIVLVVSILIYWIVFRIIESQPSNYRRHIKGRNRP